MKRLVYLICIIILSLNLFSQENLNYRAIHIGGNWGKNFDNITQSNPPVFPPEYFDWLCETGANWVGISVALHVNNSLDSIVKRKYTANIPTFTDEKLELTIREFKSRGYRVYLTLAFEFDNEPTNNPPVKRWQLGDPKMFEEDPAILLENWPWAIAHPLHDQFVNSFFNSYANEAKHFAAIAENEQVDMFSLGTETERLFRTRSGGYWPNDYKTQLQNMVDSVRSVYSGLLTYDMSYQALTDNGFYGIGSDSLWVDLNLDVIGISSYFQLYETNPTKIASVDTLDYIWDNIVNDYFVPLKNGNPDLPVVLLEFGYVNDMNSPFQPSSGEFQYRTFHDDNGNGLDDEEEVQANIYESFFNAIKNHNYIIEGAFLWGNEIASDPQYVFWNQMKHFGIRDKVVESKVQKVYRVTLLDSTICEGESLQIGDSVFSQSGNYTVKMVNQFGCDSIIKLTLSIDENCGIALNLSVENETYSSGSECLNAYDTITVAGNGSTVNFESGSTVTLIAGKSIRFLPGSYAQLGSNIHAYITIDNSFCDALSLAMASEKSISEICYEEFSRAEEANQEVIKPWLKVFPNPHNGQFKIHIKNIEFPVQVMIFNFLGAVVYQTETINDFTTIDLSSSRSGIYCIKVISQKELFAQSSIKMMITK
ncbi:MAG: T9SS type A sorting domain-containing protein [Prolixibacteraceae bacterium]|nr:T9SS type A sorting domain-containing protein [Prolixibacteraceae bacterium]